MYVHVHIYTCTYLHAPVVGDKVEMSETDDTVEIDGQVFNKPFVEKPLSAEDHRVYIYFPADLGGGCQQLFRKVPSVLVHVRTPLQSKM